MGIGARLLYMYICVCVLYCVLKTSGQDAGGNTYNLHFINFYCNTCHNVNCFSSTFVWSVFCKQFHDFTEICGTVLVFYKKCIHFSFYSEDVLNVLCLFIHDKLFFDISQAKTSWIGHKFEKLNNALTCSSSAVIAIIAVFLPANFIYSESDIFFKCCCLLVSVFSLSPTLLIVTRSVHTCIIINSIIIIDFLKPITCILWTHYIILWNIFFTVQSF